MTDEELLARATCFELLSYSPGNNPDRIMELKVERRTHLDDPQESWSIMNGNECLSHDGQWEYEPRPSERTRDFLQRCRWSNLREAIAFAQKHMAKYPNGYKPEPEETT